MRPDRNPTLIHAGLPLFPVFGENHPLVLGYRRFLVRGAVIAGSAHLAIFAGWFVARSLQEAPEPVESRIIIIDSITDFAPPPSIVRNEVTPQATPIPIGAQLELGIPEPVADWKAPDALFPTNEDLERSYEPAEFDAGLGMGGGEIVLQIPEPQSNAAPEPGEFVAAEEMPELIHMPSPVYPDMARQAEVEGTVRVLVLVGKDGKVVEARIDEGIPMLDAAALAAARGAVFRPALQQHRPVMVWVRIPMTFRLSG